MASIAAQSGINGILNVYTKVMGAIKGFGQSALESYAHFEDVQNSLNGLVGGVEKGKEMFEDLRSFSFQTTFGVDQLAAASAQLMQTGTSAKNLKSTLLQLGNIAGGNAEKFNRLVEVYSKMQNMGKLGGQLKDSMTLMGIPIENELKKIGVTGTATAEQVSQAFQNMTSEGGMFYNTMQDINNTMSGKQSTVDATMGELLTQFAETSGLADAWKEFLDIAQNALQHILELLQSLDSHPILKAIFQGTLLALLTGLVTFMTVSMVKAIASVIVKLWAQYAATMATASAQAILNPALLAGVIAAGAATVAFIAYATAQSDASGATADANEIAKETIPTISELRAKYGDASSAANDFKSSVDNLNNSLSATQIILNSGDVADEYARNLSAAMLNTESAINAQKQRIQELKDAEIQLAADKYATGRGAVERDSVSGEVIGFTESAKIRLAEYRKAYPEMASIVSESTQSQIDAINNYISVLENEQRMNLERIDAWNAVTEAANKFKESNDFVDSIIATGKTETDKLKDQLERINGMYSLMVQELDDDGNITSRLAITDPVFKKKLDDAKKLIEEKLSQAKPKVKVTVELSEWQKVLKNALHLEDNDVVSGSIAIATYTKNLETQKKTLKDFGNMLGIDELQIVTENFNDIKKAMDAIGRSGLWTSDEKTIQKLKELKDEYQTLTFDKTIESLHQEYEWLKLGTEELKKQNELKEFTNQGYSANQADALLKRQTANTKMGDYVDAKKESDIIDLSNGFMVGLDNAMKIYDTAAKKYDAMLAEYQASAAEFLAANDEYEEAQRKYDEIINNTKSTKEEKETAIKNRDNAETKFLAISGKVSQDNLNVSNSISDKKQVEEILKANAAMETFRDSCLSAAGELGGFISSAQNYMEIMNNSDATAEQKSGAVQSLVGAVISIVTSAIDAMGSELKGRASSAFEAIKPSSIIGTIFSRVTVVIESLGHVVEPVMAIFQALGDILNVFFTIVKPILRVFEVVLLVVAKVIQMIAKVLNAIMDVLSPIFDCLDNVFDWFSDLLGIQADITDAEEDQAAQLEELNDEYSNLLDAIKEQEDYYLQKKQEINAETYSESIGSKSVNDMILTPQGRFSTDPNDYIIATKNPASLSNSSGNTNLKMSVKIENTISNIADIQTSTGTDEEGNEQLIVSIISRVASDIASGDEGMDDALSYRESRMGGRYITA